MALEIKQNLKLSQQLVITPQLQQAIKLLQLSQPELVEAVEKELLENPLLEDKAQSPEDIERQSPELNAEREGIEGTQNTKETSHTEEVGPSDKEPSDFDWENYLNTYNSAEMGTGINRDFDDLPSFESTMISKTDLSNHLIWQLQLGSFDKDEIEVGKLIIGGINEEGYFQDSLEEIAEQTSFPYDFVEHVLERIQQFDPVGVGARHLKECLLLQVKQVPEQDQALLREIIENYLELLERRDLGKIAKNLKIPIEQVDHLVRILYEFEPKPGREYSGGDTQYITPDVYVKKLGDEWTVILNEDGLPKLKVNNLYKSLVEGNQTNSESSTKATKDYVQEKLKSALWLIRSIHQRQRTLYKTAKTIVKFQKDFFEKGISHLKPMILRDVADSIEMHESTVSRVTTNKYMHTPHGIFELKYFFNSGVSTSYGEGIASESIKTRIKSLISQENPKKPLSDQTIVRLLKDVDIEIARRTVAKYREVLGIQPSSKRRQLY